MRTLSCIVVLLLSGIVVGAPVDSVVMLEIDLGNGFLGYGSGTIVASERRKSLIQTAAHVAPQGTKGVKVFHKGKEYKGEYLAGSEVVETQTGPNSYQLEIKGPDLAILTVEEALPAAELALESPKKGARIRQWGFGGKEVGEEPSYKTGEVEEPDTLYATLDARPGDSGSAVFNDDDLVCGVTSARPADEKVNGVYAVPIGKVRSFLKSRAIGFPKLRESLEEPKPTLFRCR